MFDGNAILDEILPPQGEAGGGLAVDPSPRVQPKGVIQKVNYSHDGMIDLIIADPGISQNEIARRLRYSVGWVSQVMCSDAFQARLADRTKEIVDPVLRETAEAQFKGVLLRSLDIMRQKLNREAAEIPDNLALRTMEISARALGYGARPQVQINNFNSGERLDALASNLDKLIVAKRAQVIDAEFTESSGVQA